MITNPGLGLAVRVPPSGRQSRRCTGFTLLEIIVALAIGALVALLAHAVFAAVSTEGRALAAARERLDREANARRWLAASWLSLEVDTAGAEFDGRADRVAFTTWLRTADGWFERRRIILAAEGARLLAAVMPGQPLVLCDSVQEVAFDYLLALGAESRWVPVWASSASAPLAVRMRVRKVSHPRRESGGAIDTLLFLIKERG